MGALTMQVLVKGFVGECMGQQLQPKLYRAQQENWDAEGCLSRVLMIAQVDEHVRLFVAHPNHDVPNLISNERHEISAQYRGAMRAVMGPAQT
jgi:hypothetical protein